MIGCFVARKCRVACLFFESSQQPTCPQERQSRRCTHSSPASRHSSHPSVRSVTVRVWSMWPHFFPMTTPGKTLELLACRQGPPFVCTPFLNYYLVAALALIPVSSCEGGA